MSFFASIRGHFPLIGISGTLTSWISRRHPISHYRETRDHAHSRYFQLTKRLAQDLESLHKLLTSSGASGRRYVVVLLENTHETTADLLRDTFARKGHLVPHTDWANQR